MYYICSPLEEAVFFIKAGLELLITSRIRFFAKKIKKRFGESNLKRLSLHPLLTSSCSKKG